MRPLEGKTAIITGANQGLGKVCAKAYLEAGASLVICARNEEMLKATYDELLGSTDSASQRLNWLTTDVSRVQDVERLIDFALEKNPRIDILVNNAGVYGPKGCIEDVDWEEWTRTIEINLYGPILMSRALLPHFKTNKAGKIINMSGGGATAPLPRLSAYAASKAAVVRLTETMAHETLGCGIDVNAIAPGALNTRMLDEILEAGPNRVGKDYYERALKQKEDGGASMMKAAELCVYLASDESDGVTGKLISAVWDPWKDLARHLNKLKSSEIYTLRRIVPADRGEDWG
ncbi:MAG: SDR family oxidoreductase [Cyanobacteria bacterium SZAS-4]|nr:SDR family oxidoreductase [Cyanobacteria bacterium SZAS-4]